MAKRYYGPGTAVVWFVSGAYQGTGGSPMHAPDRPQEGDTRQFKQPDRQARAEGEMSECTKYAAVARRATWQAVLEVWKSVQGEWSCI